MLTPGIYYPNKNAHRQLLSTLPGKQIYPTDSNYIHYTRGTVFYLNRLPQYPAGTTVTILLNGQTHGTADVLDATGLYVYEFTPPYGTVEIKSVFPDDNTATQTFFCVNLYTLLAANAAVWSDYRQRNTRLIASQFLTPHPGGIFQDQADQELMSNSFGAAIGFPQPFDWPFERYAAAMGGATAAAPSIYGALHKGASVGAVKDIVLAVTGYTMAADDFTGLQYIGWQLGRAENDTYRYRYSGVTGSPVLDTDPGNTGGPHYYLPYNQFSVEFPTLAMEPINATVIGNSPDSISLPSSQIHFCTSLTIDGQTFDDTLDYVIDSKVVKLRTPVPDDYKTWPNIDPELWPLAAPLNTYEEIALSIQTRIRFIGHYFGRAIGGQVLGDGWRQATVVYDAANHRFLLRTGTAGALGSVGPIVGESPPGEWRRIFWSDPLRYGYVAGQDTVATIVGGTVADPGATAGVTYATQISIDGQSPDTTFFVAGPFTTGGQVAAAIQADMRRIGELYHLGVGWTACACEYDTGNERYIFRSGNDTLNGVIDTWTEGAGGDERPLLGEGYRESYSPGLTMYVWVNGELIPSSRFYVRSEAGVTRCWIAGLRTGDQVTINYTSQLGANESISATVPQITGLAPTAILQSGSQQAHTLLLNIVHDGFFVNGESVLRAREGNADRLTYEWLNPWGQSDIFVPPDREWQHVGVTAAGVEPDRTITAAYAPQQGSEFVAINGVYLAPDAYTYTTPTSIRINDEIEWEEGDYLQWDYPLSGPIHQNHMETVAVPAAPYVVSIAGSAPRPQDLHVFVNGIRQPADQYLLAGNDITIYYADFAVGDRIHIKYITTGVSAFHEITRADRIRNFEFDYEVDTSSVHVLVNGTLAPAGAFTMLDYRTVQLSTAVYAVLQAEDQVTVMVDTGIPAGYGVTILQGTTQYDQGTHFRVDYTHGRILWIDGADQPEPGTAFQAHYVYFPKQILERLLRMAQPATVRTVLQFTTTLGQVFSPYNFQGVLNPSGDVILPE